MTNTCNRPCYLAIKHCFPTLVYNILTSQDTNLWLQNIIIQSDTRFIIFIDSPRRLCWFLGRSEGLERIAHPERRGFLAAGKRELPTRSARDHRSMQGRGSFGFIWHKLEGKVCVFQNVSKQDFNRFHIFHEIFPWSAGCVDYPRLGVFSVNLMGSGKTACHCYILINYKYMHIWPDMCTVAYMYLHVYMFVYVCRSHLKCLPHFRVVE